MNLFKESKNYLIWFFQVFGAFFRVRPWSTIWMVAMATCSRVTYVLAIFMPLKVILLAGSNGIPSYFQPIVPVEYKLSWIIILAIGTIVCYVISVVLDTLTDRLSLAGSEQILQEARVIPFLNNQQDVIGSYYASFCRILADSVFVLATIVAGFFLDFWLFVFVTGLIFGIFFISALLLKKSDHIRPGIIAAYIHDKLNNYLKTLSSVVFLSSFIFMLIPFIVSDYSNILAAILSIILIRQMLTAKIGVIRDAVKLSGARHQINALVFRDVQFQPKENALEKAHKELFGKTSRQKYLERELNQIMRIGGQPDVAWKDPIIPGLDTFAVTVPGNPNGENLHLLQQVFPPKHFQKLEHELFLFEHIPRQRLRAPEMVSLLYTGPFRCQICEGGAGSLVPKSEWSAAEVYLAEQIWSCRPPADLIRIYAASAPLLHHRLNRELVAWLEIAADTEAEMEMLQRLMAALDQIKEKLKSLPMYIYNPDLKRNNVINGFNDELFVMSWCRWSLEPIGAGMPQNLRKKNLAAIIEKVCEARDDIDETFSEEDVLFAANCFDFVSRIKNKKYKAAFSLLDRILPIEGELEAAKKH